MCLEPIKHSKHDFFSLTGFLEGEVTGRLPGVCHLVPGFHLALGRTRASAKGFKRGMLAGESFFFFF